jgi:hypothetical protein
MTFTVSPTIIMMTIPVIGAIYAIAVNRKWIWHMKRQIVSTIMVIASISSVGGLGIGKVVEAKDARQKEQSEAALVRLQNLPECERLNEMFLPGEWWDFYKALEGSSHYGSKIRGVVAFYQTYSTSDVPPLSMQGYDLILDQFAVRSVFTSETSKKQIDEAKKYLDRFVVPFGPPVCRYVEHRHGPST